MKAIDDPRSVIRRHSQSFSLAARLLARAPRRRAEALYAWCRAADDAIDLAPSPRAARAALDALHAGLDCVYDAKPTDNPALVALKSVVTECALPRRYPEDLLAGMAMDVAGTRYDTADELLIYCYRVAGVVGLMMGHALGVSDERGLPHAAHLGIAMQLSNIARDVGEDWSRGRLYLPTEWLGKTPNSGPAVDDAAFEPATRRVLELADRYYDSADAGLKYLDPRSRVAVRVARTVYASIGAEVALAGYRASAGRAVVPAWRKWWLVLASVATECTQTPNAKTTPVRSPVGTWDFRPLV